MEEKVKEAQNTQRAEQQGDDLKRGTEKLQIQAEIFKANEREFAIPTKNTKGVTVPDEKDVKKNRNNYMEVRVYDNNVKEVQR